MKWCGNWNAGVVIALAIGVVWALVEAGAFGAEADGRIVVGTEGTGAPVVFVPGLMSSPDVYDAAIAGLTEAGSGGVTIHKAGLAGMGGTPPVADPAPYVAPAVDALIAYLEQAAPGGEAKLVGHSMGGVIALLAASKRPDLVDSVLVIDAVPFLPALLQPGITADTAAAQGTAMAAQIAAASDEQFLGFVQQGLARQADAEHWPAILEMAAASDRASVAAALADMMGSDWRAAIDGLAVPVTVLVPHNAAMGVPAAALEAAYGAQYQGAAAVTLTVVPDSHHFIMYDRPAAFSAALSAFIAGAAKEEQQ